MDDTGTQTQNATLPAIKQRLWHNFRQSVSDWVRRQSMVCRLATEHGFTTRVLNDGQHWEFTRDKITLEWWPSTGRMFVNKAPMMVLVHTFTCLRGALRNFT